MEILILIPFALLGMLLYAVIAVTRLRGHVQRLDDELRRLRTDLFVQERRGGAQGEPAAEAAEWPRALLGSRPTVATRPPTEARPSAAPVPVLVPVAVPPLRAANGVTMAPKPPAPMLPRAQSEAIPPKPPPAPPVPDRAASPFAGINLEQFMGVKLFAWIGGLALFLGAAFFVKHSFEQGWVSPQLRVTAGFLAGLGLLVGGVWLRRKEYSITSHTLCGAGVVILYLSSFAAYGYYQLIGHGTSFALMSLVTVTAFLLADRLRAVPVAVLGILGGFLTPPLLATDVDRPFGLFSYIALLDTALLAVALRRRWHYLVVLGACGTVLTQLGWAGRFFAVEKVVTALAIFAVFNLLFLGGLAVARRLRQVDEWISGPALAMPFVTFAFTGWLLTFRELGAQPGVLFSFLLLADLCVMAMVVMESWQREERTSGLTPREGTRPTVPNGPGLLTWPHGLLTPRAAHLAAGAAVFLLLAIWTTAHLEAGLLNWALGGYLGFALLHTLFPWLLDRQRPGTGLLWQAHLFPPLALILAMLPMFQTIELTWLIWPLVLLVDVLAIGLALLSGVVFTVLAVLALTVVVTAVWLLNVPAEVTVMPEFLVVVGLFAVFFFAVSLALGRRLGAAGATGSRTSEPPPGLPAWLAGLERGTSPEAWRDLLPATSAILPFLLLIMAVGRLPLVNPTPVFGLGLLLVALLLAATRLLRVDVLAPVALGCVLALEFVWHNTRFSLNAAGVTLAWYIGFAVIFMVYPFAFRSALAGRILPWAASALSGPLHFYLVYQAVKLAWPNEVMGLLPAAFAAPMLGALAFVLRKMPVEGEGRVRLLAWFGGSALFFITLIFPIQFDRQWITLGWALEGAALLWLFHRVPHPGLRGLGVVLLGVAFIRLALNPAVFDYHARSATAVLNWFLYSYGIVTACLVAGARLLAPPRNHVFRVNAPPILYTLAAVLGFLLLNIEIADGFSTGASLTFDFNASLGQNMTYSLAWGLYALGLLVLGFRFQSAGARYGGLGLLVVTLLKLFLSDLWQLGGLYRVGSLLGLAVVLIVVSFAYQRFFGFPARGKDGPSAPTESATGTETSRPGSTKP